MPVNLQILVVSERHYSSVFKVLPFSRLEGKKKYKSLILQELGIFNTQLWIRNNSHIRQHVWRIQLMDQARNTLRVNRLENRRQSHKII